MTSLLLECMCGPTYHLKLPTVRSPNEIADSFKIVFLLNYS